MGRIIFIILFSVIKLTSCISFWRPTYIQEVDYNFIDNRFLKVDRENPLYKYAHIPSLAYENRVAYYQNIRKKLNLKEWASYLNISPKEAEGIVYQNNSPQIIQDIEKRKEFISYKKSLNIFAIATDEYREIDWKLVLNEFKPLFNQSRDKFFKTRIAYNIVRAYHHLNKFDKEIAFIDSLKKTDSIVWEWIDSYRTGAIKQKGDRVKASYLFAKIFATHKSDAYIGYYDFDIRSDREWESLIKMAKNPQEETLFHFLRAINPKNNELLELIDMTQIDSDSTWVDRLLYLVAQKAQYRVFLLKSGYHEEFYNLKKKDLELYIDSFLDYLKKNQIDDFHKYLLSYFEYIYQNKNNPTEPKVKRLLAYLKFIDTLNKIDENEISKKLKNTENFFKGSGIEKSLERYTFNKLSELYPKDSLKAQLASYFDDYGRMFDGIEFRKRLTLNSLNEFITLKNKKDKNYIEQLLLSSRELFLEPDLINLYYGVLYTRNMNFARALEYIRDLKLPNRGYDDIEDGYRSSFMRVSMYNPFNVGFSGNNRETNKNMSYSHKKFLTTMLKIENELQKNPNSVIDNFLMATGLYNISDFGNSPMFAMVYRGTSIINSKNLNLLEKSEFFYNKVLSLSKNRELRAKVYYQLLKISLDKKLFEYHKIDKNRYYFKPTFKELNKIYELVKNSPEYQGRYKRLLEYKDTKYFKKIENCATFKYFK